MRAHIRKVQDAGRETVLKIGGEVSDLIGQIDELRFQRRLLVQKIFRKSRMFRGIVVARVLDDAFAYAKREIQPRESDIALLEDCDDAQCVQIVVEAQAVSAHGFIQSVLAGVSERRVADIVHQGE